MALFGWPDCPDAVRDQIGGLLEHIQMLLGSALASVYLYGSLAYGCFNPERSDIDLLILAARPVLPDAKLGLVKTFLRCSTAPAPLELSVVARADLVPWQYPPPYQLHYSEAWRERLTAETSGLAWLGWPTGVQGTDPDLAAHLTMTRARGIALIGPPPAEVVPEAPPADYLAAIVADNEAALARPLTNPVATILNLCRLAWYLRANVLSSKEEAGIWAQESARPAHRALIAQAFAVYRGDTEPSNWDGDAIRRFGHQVLAMAAAGPAEPASGPQRQLQLDGEQ